MTARIIDGKTIAKRIEGAVAAEVRSLGPRSSPQLVAVLVGNDPASLVYLRRKGEAAERVGIRSRTERLPETTTTQDAARELGRLAGDDDVDGILLQLPLPAGLDADALLERIPPDKDVDGFHPHNVGLTALGRGRLVACTAQGVLEILDHERVPLKGAEVVVVNHSHVVGRPLAELLLSRDATVTVCHKFTKDLAAHTRRADVLVSATGVPGLIRGEHVKPGAVVIDVGIARLPDGTLAGDVRFDEVKEVASAITPVPGGVGPLTVAVLMRNVLRAYQGRPQVSREIKNPKRT